jgi:hypothetical protein
MKMRYNYRNIAEIDYQTLDYLRFVAPMQLTNDNITEINKFLNELEDCFFELDGSKEPEYE